MEEEEEYKKADHEAYAFLITVAATLALMSRVVFFPDLSVAHWFRLHRNSHVCMEASVLYAVSIHIQAPTIYFLPK